MKKFFLIAVLGVSLAACQLEGPDGYPPYNDSYIQSFVAVDGIEVRTVIGLEVDDATHNLALNNFFPAQSGVPYHADDVALLVRGTASQGEYNEMFEDKAPQGREIYYEYIHKIGDTGFKSKRRFGFFEHVPKAITVPLESIEITCDKDFNQDFPCGSNLSSGFVVLFEYPYWVVKHGYQGYEDGYKRSDILFSDFPYAIVGGELSSMSFKDKQFIGSAWICKPKISPRQTGEYTFTVKVTASDGREWEQKTEPLRLLGDNSLVLIP